MSVGYRYLGRVDDRFGSFKFDGIYISVRSTSLYLLRLGFQTVKYFLNVGLENTEQITRYVPDPQGIFGVNKQYKLYLALRRRAERRYGRPRRVPDYCEVKKIHRIIKNELAKLAKHPRRQFCVTLTLFTLISNILKFFQSLISAVVQVLALTLSRGSSEFISADEFFLNHQSSRKCRKITTWYLLMCSRTINIAWRAGQTSQRTGRRVFIEASRLGFKNGSTSNNTGSRQGDVRLFH